MVSNKIVRVTKISLKQHDILTKAGYLVELVQNHPVPEVYIKYQYQRIINPPRSKRYRPCKPGCDHKFSSVCPGGYNDE